MPTSKRDEALRLAEDLLGDIELSRISPTNIIKKTSRLARLLDDDAAMTWLSYEIGGFAQSDPKTLRDDAASAARRSHRSFLDAEGVERFNVISVGQLEADVEAAKLQLASAMDRNVAITSANPNQTVFTPMGNARERDGLRAQIAARKGVLEKVIGSIHEYVSARYQELRFGSAVETAFEVVRKEVDRSIATLVPEALAKLSAAFENVSSDNPEHWANAAATCRRLLEATADALRPPGPDVNGRVMAQANYINRLVDWIEQQSESKTRADLVVADLAFLGNRLDAVLDAGHKGTHADVSRFDASRFVTGTYLLLGDILALSQPSAEEENSQGAPPEVGIRSPQNEP